MLKLTSGIEKLNIHFFGITCIRTCSKFACSVVWTAIVYRTFI